MSDELFEQLLGRSVDSMVRGHEEIHKDCIEEIASLRAELDEKDKRIAELQNASHDAGVTGLVNEESLKSRIAELETPVPKTFQHAIRRVVITEDNRVVYDAEEDDVGCVYIVTPEVMRTEIRPILDGWDKGHFISTEQINEAWKVVRVPANAYAARQTLAALGIIPCSKCGGTKHTRDVTDTGYVGPIEECTCPNNGWVIEKEVRNEG